MKIIVDKDATAISPKTEIQEQQEALMEQKRQEDILEESLIPQKIEVIAEEASKFLGGTYVERSSSPRSALVTMLPGGRPEVTFTGFWNGQYIKVAQHALHKAYKQRQFKKFKKGDGDEA